MFPIDPQPIRNLIDKLSPETILHYDSSHINGLIFGKALFNPLTRGAHCYGGSTHKTLPGPHKGFLAMNELSIAKRMGIRQIILLVIIIQVVLYHLLLLCLR